ncbi:MAG TPA: glycosyltransferase family 2 protein [Stellaceae bacterium]
MAAVTPGQTLIERIEDWLSGPPSAQQFWRIPFKAARYLHRHGWRPTVFRVVPSLRRYGFWFPVYGRPGWTDLIDINRHIARLGQRPTISIVIVLNEGGQSRLATTAASVFDQLYPEWELLLVGGVAALTRTKPRLTVRPALSPRIKAVETAAADEAAAFNAGLAAATGEFVAALGLGDVLAPHALYAIAAEIERCPDAAIVYSDEDAISARGRHHGPRHKTDWNPDLFLGTDAIGRLAVYRRDLVAGLGGLRPEFGPAAPYDLALRASEQVAPERIRHIPLILYHRRDRRADPEPMLCRAVEEHLARTGTDATATSLPSGHVRVRRRLPTPKPPVSLIVPTRDQAGLLRQCVDGLLQRTEYDPLEIIVVDNNSEAPETFAYFAELEREARVRVLPYPGAFNFSAINNFAVAAASHEVIGLINNDIDVIHADWLDEMVSHAIRPEIGAVGAKLYYPDDTVQHGGTIVGLHGGADHAFRHHRRHDAGYLYRLRLTQNLSAVTAACLVMRKSVFDEVGGFDAENLAVAFNDVDLCLKVRAAGYRIVWTPFAELYHHESASRGLNLTPEKVARERREAGYLATRWADIIAHDPYYNPNLEITGGDFGQAFPPRTVLPWRG